MFVTHQHVAVPLNTTSLLHLPSSVSVPRYQRDELRPAIVHIGVGGFHRAHLATYIDDLCRAGRTDWAIVGAGVLAQDVRMEEVLGEQDGLYTLVTRGPQETDVAVVGSIVDYIYAALSSDALVAQLAAPETQIVSLTITEGGYPIDDLSGEYRAELPTAGATSAFGILAAGLALRRERGLGGLTVMSCDNIVDNGAAAKAATLGEAARRDPALVAWVESSTTFPSSVVDRITPATTELDRSWLADNTGIVDRWPVVTEPFRQWVVEDEFAADRLPLEEMDVLSTSNVRPYELMKLRLLNAGHSCLAYVAALSGFDRVDTAISDPMLRAFVLEFLHREAKPVLPAAQGLVIDDYISSVIDRFSNGAVADQISRIALDGSSKFPKFMLPTTRAQISAEGSVSLSAFAIAAWCQYLTQTRDSLSSDPLLDVAVVHAQNSKTDPKVFLQFGEVFGEDLPNSERFVQAFTGALNSIRSEGVRSAIKSTLREVL